MSKTFILALAVVALFTSTAQANRPTEKQIGQLKTLSQLGQEACEGKDYASCLRAFEQAQAIFPWAPHEFYIAEALVGKGELVKGTSLWNEILKKNDPDKCHPSVCQAVRKARHRLNQVEPQIPRVTFQLARDYGELKVEWNGARLTPSQLDSPYAVNPGEHRLAASAPGYRSVSETYRLALNETRTILLELAPAATPLANGAAEPRSWPLPVGISLAAAGGVALATGMATWSSKSEKLAEYKSACSGTETACSRNDTQATDIENLTSISNALFVGGSVLLAAGSATLLWHWSSVEAPDQSSRAGAALSIGPLNMTLSGTF